MDKHGLGMTNTNISLNQTSLNNFKLGPVYNRSKTLIDLIFLVYILRPELFYSRLYISCQRILSILRDKIVTLYSS